LFLNWLFEGHKEVEEDNFLGQNEMVENVRESSGLWIAGFTADYKFREDNAPLYGLGDELFDVHHAILKSGYKDLLKAWTLETKAVYSGELLLELVSETIQSWWEPSKSNDDPKKPSSKTVLHMVHALPKELHLFQRMSAER
jgi:hypothetical protein